MTISLGKTPDDPRVIRKTFNTVASFSGSLKNDSSIIYPTVRIAGNVGSVAGCNYMHIPEFGRYYFITNIVSIANNLAVYSLLSNNTLIVSPSTQSENFTVSLA